jgi:hypothetical protein
MDRDSKMKRNVLGVLLLGAIFIGAGEIAWRSLSFGERAVAAALTSIPGVRVQAVWGSADLPPRWYYARIDVAGAPSAYLYQLTRASFNGTDGFCFFQVGEYAVRYTAYGNFGGGTPGSNPQATLSNALCFDRSGKLSAGLEIFPAPIRGVREFVRDVQVVRRALAELPRCPQFKDLTGRHGRYRLCTDPDVSSDIYPPEHDWTK